MEGPGSADAVPSPPSDRAALSPLIPSLKPRLISNGRKSLRLPRRCPFCAAVPTTRFADLARDGMSSFHHPRTFLPTAPFLRNGPLSMSDDRLPALAALLSLWPLSTAGSPWPKFLAALHLFSAVISFLRSLYLAPLSRDRVLPPILRMLSCLVRRLTQASCVPNSHRPNS